MIKQSINLYPEPEFKQSRTYYISNTKIFNPTDIEIKDAINECIDLGFVPDVYLKHQQKHSYLKIINFISDISKITIILNKLSVMACQIIDIHNIHKQDSIYPYSLGELINTYKIISKEEFNYYRTGKRHDN